MKLETFNGTDTRFIVLVDTRLPATMGMPGSFVRRLNMLRSFGTIVAIVADSMTILWSSDPVPVPYDSYVLEYSCEFINISFKVTA